VPKGNATWFEFDKRRKEETKRKQQTYIQRERERERVRVRDTCFECKGSEEAL